MRKAALTRTMSVLMKPHPTLTRENEHQSQHPSLPLFVILLPLLPLPLPLFTLISTIIHWITLRIIFP